MEGCPAEHRNLIQEAASARENAYAPYSGFKVGAALEVAGKQKIIYRGANIENASLGLTLCAERVALFAAVSQGERHFSRLAVVSAGSTPPYPCGACLQVIKELASKLQILCYSLEGELQSYHLEEFLPYPFEGW